MGTKKELAPIDAHAAEILTDLVSSSGLSYRDLRSKTGLSINRIGIILRKESPPLTVGEIWLLARVLGTTASSVLEEAERRAKANEADPAGKSSAFEITRADLEAEPAESAPRNTGSAQGRKG